MPRRGGAKREADKQRENEATAAALAALDAEKQRENLASAAAMAAEHAAKGERDNEALARRKEEAARAASYTAPAPTAVDLFLQHFGHPLHPTSVEARLARARKEQRKK